MLKKTFNKAGFRILTLLVLSLLFLPSCQSTKNNNTKNIWDIVQHFKQSGLQIQTMQPLLAAPLKCEQAIAIKIAGRQIGIYKYNTRWKKSVKRLQRIKEKGHIYILGKQFEAMVNGSFVMIDYEKNKEKDKIIQAFESF